MERPSVRVLLMGMACFLALAGCIFIGPEVDIEPDSLRFAAQPGGEDPPGQRLLIADRLTSTPPYQVSATADWITIAYPQDCPGPPATSTSDACMVSVIADGLPEGEHHAEVRFTDADGFLVATVPVTLTISPDAVALTGVILSNVMEIDPRQVHVYFLSDVPEDQALALIDSSGATIIDTWPIRNAYYVETPLGTSLLEATEYFEASVLVENVYTGVRGLGISAGSHRLTTEEGGLYWLFNYDRYDWAHLDGFMREWIVEVRGIQTHDNLEGAPAVEVYSVVALAPNYLTVHGTITLAGPAGEYVLLIADSGEVWELLGPVADEIAGLSDIDGVDVTVTGIDKGVSMDAHSGGLRFEVNSYELDCASTSVPPPPADVYAIPGPAFITIWWSPVPGAASYNVYLTFDGSLPSKLNGTKVESVISPWVHQTHLDITHRCVVTALNACGESGESEVVGGTPWLITIPTLPPPEPLP